LNRLAYSCQSTINTEVHASHKPNTAVACTTINKQE